MRVLIVGLAAAVTIAAPLRAAACNAILHITNDQGAKVKIIAVYSRPAPNNSEGKDSDSDYDRKFLKLAKAREVRRGARNQQIKIPLQRFKGKALHISVRYKIWEIDKNPQKPGAQPGWNPIRFKSNYSAKAVCSKKMTKRIRKQGLTNRFKVTLRKTDMSNRCRHQSGFDGDQWQCDYGGTASNWARWD